MERANWASPFLGRHSGSGCFIRPTSPLWPSGWTPIFKPHQLYTHINSIFNTDYEDMRSKLIFEFRGINQALKIQEKDMQRLIERGRDVEIAMATANPTVALCSICRSSSGLSR